MVQEKPELCLHDKEKQISIKIMENEMNEYRKTRKQEGKELDRITELGSSKDNIVNEIRGIIKEKMQVSVYKKIIKDCKGKIYLRE